MNQDARITAARLRQRADHCRDLAHMAASAAIAAELQSIAHDYDRDAMRLELQSAAGPPT